MKKKNKKITFGIIGYGRFGKMWARHMSKYGQIFVYDRKTKTATDRGVITADMSRVLSADIVFLSVPISNLERLCRTISPLLNPKTLVADVCSVKTLPVRVLKNILPQNQPILATHPLFGPDSEKINNGLGGFKIVVCKVSKAGPHGKKLMGIFKKMKLKVIFTSSQEHDRQMAKSQALVHFIGRGLAKLKLKPEEISTPDYDSLVRMNNMVNNDTRQLFFDMQNKNPYAAAVRRKLIRALEELDKSAALGKNNLESLRESIEQTDASIIKLLSHRLKIIQKIGKLKREQKLSLINLDRERRLLDLHHRLGKRGSLDPKFTDDVFRLIINHSRAVQKKKK